jgi:predicted secreted Zn-dependent protease
MTGRRPAPAEFWDNIPEHFDTSGGVLHDRRYGNGGVTMTKQDYIAIAAILSNARTCPNCTSAQPTIDHITRELADVMASGNTRFDRERFYGAAGMEEGQS